MVNYNTILLVKGKLYNIKNMFPENTYAGICL